MAAKEQPHHDGASPQLLAKAVQVAAGHVAEAGREEPAPGRSSGPEATTPPLRPAVTSHIPAAPRPRDPR